MIGDHYQAAIAIVGNALEAVMADTKHSGQRCPPREQRKLTMYQTLEETFGPWGGRKETCDQ